MADLSIPHSFAFQQTIPSDGFNQNFDSIADYINASIASKVADSGTPGQVVIVNGSNVPALQTVTGHVAVASNGATTIQGGVITEAMLTAAVRNALGIGARDSAEVAAESARQTNAWGNPEVFSLDTPGPSITLDVPAGGGTLLFASVEARLTTGNTTGRIGIREATDQPLSGAREEGEEIINVTVGSYPSLPYKAVTFIPSPAGGSRTYTMYFTVANVAEALRIKNRKLFGIAFGGFS